MSTKRCCKCEKVKPLNEFSKDKSRPDGLAYRCKQCEKERQQKYCVECHKELKDYQHTSRRNYLLSEYGITLREYDLMLELQGGGCAICGRTPESNGQRLSVDHDHETGEVRELLCRNCNLSLGLLNDDPEICERMKLYLYKHGK